jgi:hypothetical protein
MACAGVVLAEIPDSVLSRIKGWHGSIDDQYYNIVNLVRTISDNQQKWKFPAEALNDLVLRREQLRELIALCRSNDGSANDRMQRNSLLKATVGLCLTYVKSWAYSQYYGGVLTVDDVHTLGFFLPGERSGFHKKKEATDALAEVKVTVLNMNFIRVVIDQASSENAALVVHGWPEGVRQAIIKILTADGKTEIYSQMTTRLHNDIEMPKDSKGKLFIIKAAFLRHIDDVPKFGPEPTFSMPYTTEDLASLVDKQHHEEYEAQLREIERHRQEVERLMNELKSKEQQ